MTGLEFVIYFYGAIILAFAGGCCLTLGLVGLWARREEKIHQGELREAAIATRTAVATKEGDVIP